MQAARSRARASTLIPDTVLRMYSREVRSPALPASPPKSATFSASGCGGDRRSTVSVDIHEAEQWYTMTIGPRWIRSPFCNAITLVSGASSTLVPFLLPRFSPPSPVSARRPEIEDERSELHVHAESLEISPESPMPRPRPDAPLHRTISTQSRRTRQEAGDGHDVDAGLGDHDTGFP